MRLVLRLAAVLALVLASAAQAQYPNRPIRLIIASSPGGGVDGIGRVLAEALSANLKQPVVPENRPGASGVIASEALVKSSPDGYTLMITQNGHTTNPAMFKSLPYDTFKDFTPIAPIASSPLVLIATSGIGARSVKDMLELAKRDPRAMSFARRSPRRGSRSSSWRKRPASPSRRCPIRAPAPPSPTSPAGMSISP